MEWEYLFAQMSEGKCVGVLMNGTSLDWIVKSLKGMSLLEVMNWLGKYRWEYVSPPLPNKDIYEGLDFIFRREL